MLKSWDVSAKSAFFVRFSATIATFSYFCAKKVLILLTTYGLQKSKFEGSIHDVVTLSDLFEVIR